MSEIFETEQVVDVEMLRAENAKTKITLLDEISMLRDEIERLRAEIKAWRERFDPYGVSGFDGKSIVMSG